MTTITVKGINFKVQNIGSIVRVENPVSCEIIECAFPSRHYTSPEKFVGKAIGFLLADC